MRKLLIVLSMLLGSAISAHAQISINIGINVPSYPQLVLVPGYPVYYDPRANSNYFFYDGLYWVYQGDNWYRSSWYNGPWQLTGPEYVPLFVLRIPVRYYRRPPVYFRGWRADAPPHWGKHWGHDWERRRSGWDRWDRRAAPAAAPLPIYQRQYSGDRYPRAAEQQNAIRSGNYRYHPREAVTRQHFQQATPQKQPRQQAPQPQQPRRQQEQRPPQPQQRAQPQPQRQQEQQWQHQQRMQQQHAQPQHPQQPQAQQQRQPRQEQQRQHRETAPQDNGRNNNAAPQGKGRDIKNEERDHGR